MRAWYSATTAGFLRASPDAVLGQLAANSGFAVSPNQRDAWLAEIEILQDQLAGLSGSVFLEFSIPRMGKRIDAVLLVENVVVAVEFKVGETRYERGAIEQVWDYALDLKNFHEASHSLAIVPVLIATGAAASLPLHLEAADDGVYRPVCANRRGLRRLLEHLLTLANESRVDGPGWALAPYHPTPTIVEAARALYAQHSVEAIARFDAGAQNLAITSARIEEIVYEARSGGRKAICLVTGVPGAGKTLVGLNLATRRSQVAQPSQAVFLSGNGYAPVVTVRDGRGVVVKSGPVVFMPRDGNYTSLGVVKVPDAKPRQIGLNGFFLPTAMFDPMMGPVSVFPDAKDPLLVLTAFVAEPGADGLGVNSGVPQSVYVLDTSGLTQLKDDKGSPVRMQLAPGETFTLPGGVGSVTFEGFKRYAAFDIRHDPSKMPALVAALIALAGLTASLFVRRRRVWVRVSPAADGGSRVEAAGLARGEDAGLAMELVSLLDAVGPAGEDSAGLTGNDGLTGSDGLTGNDKE